MTNLKTVMAVTAMLALAGAPAMASDSAALAAGKPAGVQQAMRGNGHLLLVLGVAAVVVGAVVIGVASSSNATAPAASSSSSTGTAP